MVIVTLLTFLVNICDGLLDITGKKGKISPVLRWGHLDDTMLVLILSLTCWHI